MSPPARWTRSGSAMICSTVIRPLSDVVRVLEHRLHRAAQGAHLPAAQLVHHVAADADPSLVGAFQREQQAAGGGLAAAGLADEREGRAALDAQADAVDRVERAAPPYGIALGQAFGHHEVRGVRHRATSVSDSVCGCQQATLPSPSPARGGMVAHSPVSRGHLGPERAALDAIADRRHLPGDGRQLAGDRPVRVGDGPQERRRVRVLRRAQHRTDRAGLDDLPGVHHRDAVGDLGDDAHVVGDEQQHGVAGPLAQHREHLGLHGHVQRGRRLVGDEQVGTAGQRHRDHHALAHSAGQLVRHLPRPRRRVRDADRLHQLHRALRTCGPAHPAVDRQHLGDLGADLGRRVERAHRVLEDHAGTRAAYAPQRAFAAADQLGAAERRRAGGARAVGQQAQQRERGEALAAAGLADERDGLAAPGAQVDAAYGLAAGPEVDSQVTDVEERGFSHERACPTARWRRYGRTFRRGGGRRVRVRSGRTARGRRRPARAAPPARRRARDGPTATGGR